MMTSNKGIRVLSVLPVIGQPRHSKRISMLQEAGFLVEAVAFERDYHKGRSPDCAVTILGKIAQGNYLQRSLKIVKALPVVRRAIHRNHLIYASGIDMALMAIIAGAGLRRPAIVEVGDIRRIQVAAGLKGRVVRCLDRFVISICRLLVVTAPAFAENYYRAWLHVRTPTLVLENKLEAPVTESTCSKIPAHIQGAPLVDRALYIGYFGLLRCGWSWKVLELLALSRPNEIKIIAAGYPMIPADLPERAARISNIEFRGEFRSPQDLPSLYRSVDLVWGCYPIPGQGDWNWRWARTNRFYESCFFQKPMIALAGSSDAVEIERYRIGVTVDGSSVEGAVQKLSMIPSEDLMKWRENMSKVPRNVYMYTTETNELASALKGILGHC